MSTPGSENSPPSFRHWFGPSAFIAVLLLIAGRFLMEPLRDDPQFDEQGMDPFNAVETFVLRQAQKPPEIAFLGSSQTLWSIIPGNVAQALKLDRSAVCNLASPGGTPFEMWHLVERNQERLSHLRCVVLEINPFVLSEALDDDERVEDSVSQQASLSERLLLHDRQDRMLQVGEWVFPLKSVRRSLESAFLDILQPQPGCRIYPKPHQRTMPFALWRVRPGKENCAIQRFSMSAQSAARRLVYHWAPSRLQDTCMHHLLRWFDERHIPVLMHQPPVHPEVITALHKNEDLSNSYDDFLQYVDSLRPAPVQFINAFDPSVCGMTALHLSDRTHLNEMGARTYSRFFAGKIASFQEQTSLQASSENPMDIVGH